MTDRPIGPLRSAAKAVMDRPYLVLVLTSAFWGGNVVAGKLAVGHIDAYTLMLLRWIGALLVVLPFAGAQLRADWPTLRRRWWLYLFYGAIGYATFNILVYVAAYYTSGVNIALDQVSVNIFVMLFNFLLFRQRARALQLLGVAMTVAGVAVTATGGDLQRILSLNVNLGDGLLLIAGFAYACYSIGLRWRPRTGWMSFLVATFLGAIVGGLGYLWALGGGLGAFAAALPTIDAEGWTIVLYTVLFPSVIAQMFYVRGVELIGSNRASLFVNLVPLFGTIGSVIVLGERLQPFHLVAAALVALGIVLAEWSALRA
jgi:drug/metabolite transporter (DMT)-like permease